MVNSADILKQIFHSAVDAANPFKAVRRACEDIRVLFEGGGFSRLLVIGFGKASPAMARAADESLGDLIDSGIVITKYGHGNSRKHGKIRVLHAEHPIPDENGRIASEQITDMVSGADEKSLVLTLISGGGSALFVSPAGGVSLAEKQMTTDLLLRAGADIGELNAVRKHLSRVKGGRLAQLICPATTVSLILSDVIGDRLDIIASGPTAPDPTSYGDAYAVLARYDLVKKVPESVTELLVKGQMGMIPETPKPGNPVFSKVKNRIIGGNRLALEAAREKAETFGLRTEILSSVISGEARDAGRLLARKALAVKRTAAPRSPVCLISGGETTVTVTGAGKGGRNMELALSFALEIEGVPGITLLSAGTDGIDGPTDSSGAIVEGTTAPEARNRGIDPEARLQDNDSYDFFRESGGLLVTGPTGTNVMDVQLILIEA